ncbi:beta family protein [Dongia rigui]|uniref:Beta protein n=1 Tax=Dongia rigui TaxID=940149 RepID=A0ABU5DZQ8_9PROT|nr:hypothetical protein [Dongia rigui]MDY0872819.1 hypothetical protein [Dongia rigui]
MAFIHDYVPVLRWKRGERVGISHLTATSRGRVTPLFQLAPESYVGKEKTAKRAAVPAPAAFANELKAAWGTASFYLDTAKLGSAAAAELTAVAAACSANSMEMIPISYLDAPTAYQSAVAKVAASDGRGVGLRVDFAQFTDANRWAKGWPHALSATDLILDLASSVPSVVSLGNLAIEAFKKLHQGEKWRTVTLIGSSLPENFTGFASGTHEIERVEWKLWRKLNKASLPYQLDFGDYATVAVTPPPSGIRWGFPINVKYTLGDHFLVCRGVNTSGLGGVDMDVQLIDHARTITKYPNRTPLADCWADANIDEIAAKKKQPGNLESWVQFGVNRHVSLVRDSLP